MKNKIYIIGNFSFPYGNASGSRVLANGYILRDLGYEVIFIGLDNTLESNSKIQETKQFFDDFTYYNLPYPIGMKGWTEYRKRFNEVVSIVNVKNTYGVITYGSPTISLFGKLLLSWCKKNAILNIVDVVDWMDSNVGSILHRTIKFIDTTYQKRILNAKADGVITISSYLSKYYGKKGCKTLIVPPLVKIDRFKKLDIKNDFTNKINLVYIGRPFSVDGRKINVESYKDRLDIAIETLSLIKQDNFIFNIYGITKEEYLSVVTHHKNILEGLGNKIVFHGFIQNEKALGVIAKSDFTILFRIGNRMNTAGFPTKFSETISCGTPIITTDTSDLRGHIKDGENGFIVTIDNTDKLVLQLKNILSLDKKDIQKMKKRCMNSESFSYKNYVSKMEIFLRSLEDEH